jgi:hypothetical protein
MINVGMLFRRKSSIYAGGIRLEEARKWVNTNYQRNLQRTMSVVGQDVPTAEDMIAHNIPNQQTGADLNVDTCVGRTGDAPDFRSEQ